MDATCLKEKTSNLYTVDHAMNALFSKLDEALDDLENGRVLSEEEMWTYLNEV